MQCVCWHFFRFYCCHRAKANIFIEFLFIPCRKQDVRIKKLNTIFLLPTMNSAALFAFVTAAYFFSVRNDILQTLNCDYRMMKSVFDGITNGTLLALLNPQKNYSNLFCVELFASSNVMIFHVRKKVNALNRSNKNVNNFAPIQNSTITTILSKYFLKYVGRSNFQLKSTLFHPFTKVVCWKFADLIWTYTLITLNEEHYK